MATQRRRRQWQDNLINEDTPSVGQDNAVLLAGDIDDTKGMTLVRTILRLDVLATSPAIDNVDVQTVTMGIGMISAEALAISVFPDPNNATDIPLSGWLWRWCGCIIENSNGGGIVRIDVDLRTQRKVMYGSPVLIINNDPQTGTAFNVRTIGLIRCLYLLE